MLASFHQMARGFGFARQCFTARGDARELARDVDKFLDSPRDLLEIALYARTAVAKNFSRAPLIPIYPPRLNNLIQYPPLLTPALYLAFCFYLHRPSAVYLRDAEPMGRAQICRR